MFVIYIIKIQGYVTFGGGADVCTFPKATRQDYLTIIVCVAAVVDFESP